MTQIALFAEEGEIAKLPTVVERVGDKLVIPEGLHTIPVTHGLHRFPGKFVPNLPRYLIRSVLLQKPAGTVFDPFCGSGTTLVEAALEGRPFIGTDIDALSVLIASAKTTPLSDKAIRSIRRYWAHHDFESAGADLVPAVPNLSHWFTEPAIRQLASIKRGCLSLPEFQKQFCLVVFSSIIRRVSNADDQTQKTYVSRTLPKEPPEPRSLFPVFLDRALEGMRQYASLLPSEPRGLIQQADARLFESNAEVGDIITSPPYIDSIDYMYNQMLEYFWLMPELGLEDYQEFRRRRRMPMGFRRSADLSNNLYKALASHGEAFSEIVARIAETSKKESEGVSTFFEDYLTHVRKMHAAQQTGATYVSIVGNSVIRNVMVPTADLLIALHESAGYVLVDRFSYEIRRHYMKFPRRGNSGTISMDNVLVFRRE